MSFLYPGIDTTTYFAQNGWQVNHNLLSEYFIDASEDNKQEREEVQLVNDEAKVKKLNEIWGEMQQQENERVKAETEAMKQEVQRLKVDVETSQRDNERW